ncbi:MAG: terpene cyclase/mutase family protein [Gemmataceae bacterium]|nr:terpene cyclase/mutase family protein [Gemmataceae bacterium]
MKRLIVAAVITALGVAPLRAAAPGDTAKIDEATRKATASALQWLGTKQNADGSWSEARFPHNTAITAFALLAYMSQGHLPGQGPFGPEISKGTRFLLTSGTADGYLVGSRGGNMYCHAMATLALAELWGMSGDQEVRPVLAKAVDLIVRCQNREGGWRYDPTPSSADVSVTIMQVMALRAAKNGGLHVPDQTLDNAIKYILSCYDERTGGFGYTTMLRTRPGFARTAAGVCVLQLSGKHDALQIPKAVEYLKANFETREHFWYGHYYASHAMHQVGGKEWEAWYDRLKTTMLRLQSADGSWTRAGYDREGVGPCYATSIAVISLSVPAGYLPIFQR